MLEPGSSHTLANQRCVELQSTHDKLVDGRQMRMGINDYINDLRCLRDEAEFHVQIAEFERGTTSRGHKGFRSVPLHKFLSAGSGPDSGWYRPKDKDGKELLHWIHVSCNNMAWVADVLRAVSKATGSKTDLTTVVLDEEVWKSREHRPHHRSPHARYMTPLFRAFLPEAAPGHDARPKSVSFLPCPPKMSQMVLYVCPLPKAAYLAGSCQLTQYEDAILTLGHIRVPHLTGPRDPMPQQSSVLPGGDEQGPRPSQKCRPRA